MNMKKAISILLSLIMALSVFTAVPFDAAAVGDETPNPTVSNSGITGNCIWTLDDEGTLTVSGNGKMGNYGSSFYAPWSGTDVKKLLLKTVWRESAILRFTAAEVLKA